MAASVHQPHDKLFKQVFSDPSETELFLQAHLPTELTAQIDWSSLKLIETSFIDEEFQKHESDILYAVQHRKTKEPAYLYLLFEHQSSPDKWMRLRLYYYLYCIWIKSFEDDPEQELLRPILPVVFYQGQSGWTYSTEFIDLFPKYAADWGFVPQFTHFLVDQSGIAPNDVHGGLKARVMQLLMLAAFHEPIEEALRLAAELLPQLQKTGGTNYVRAFMVYVLATQEQATVQDFVQIVKQQTVSIGDEMMTYAEELLLEGEIRGEIKGKIEGEIKGKIEGEIKGKIEGEIKGKIETIESLVKAGVSWSTIAEATGIDQEKFGALKRQLSEIEHAGSAAPMPVQH